MGPYRFDSQRFNAGADAAYKAAPRRGEALAPNQPHPLRHYLKKGLHCCKPFLLLPEYPG
jgi:hypothetical protein